MSDVTWRLNDAVERGLQNLVDAVICIETFCGPYKSMDKLNACLAWVERECDEPVRSILVQTLTSLRTEILKEEQRIEELRNGRHE